MSQCKCKIVYKASDGKEFDTLEECKTYENRPKVYAIQSFYKDIDIHRAEYTTKIVGNQAYYSKKVAEDALAKLRQKEENLRLISRGYRSDFVYDIITLEVNIERPQETIQEQITNTPSDRTWLGDVLYRLFRYRGDEF